jgi:thiosulfate/3-mercaptopyruvate sulfurtransferase
MTETTRFDTLISAAQLAALAAASEPLVLLDCSFDLTDPAAGERAYAQGHIPGALYAHLDRQLAGPKVGSKSDPHFTGRHPLPAREAMAAQARAWGVSPGVQVVCYDGEGGPYAARAWWLLRWLGHASVAVLDGGRAGYVAAGGALSTAPSTARPSHWQPSREGMPTVNVAALLDAMPALADATQPPRHKAYQVLDARVAERYRGEVEPLDPVAGHIPGAKNRFFKDNLGADGLFKAPAQLRQEFEAILGAAAAGATSRIVQQCGSGVTACHNLLAMAHAGLGITALYPGSWSEWCADPARPVAKGPG